MPFGLERLLAAVWVESGQPQRWVEWCRAQLARGRDTHALTRIGLVIALTLVGCAEEARTAATDLIDAAEATHDPYVLSYALIAYRYAFHDADPDRALDALRRGLLIAQDSGNRATESGLAQNLSRIEAEHGDPVAALHHLTIAIRNYHDSGNTALMRNPLAALAALFDPARTLRAGGHHRRVRSQSPHRGGVA